MDNQARDSLQKRPNFAVKGILATVTFFLGLLLCGAAENPDAEFLNQVLQHKFSDDGVRSGIERLRGFLLKHPVDEKAKLPFHNFVCREFDTIGRIEMEKPATLIEAVIKVRWTKAADLKNLHLLRLEKDRLIDEKIHLQALLDGGKDLLILKPGDIFYLAPDPTVSSEEAFRLL